MKTMIAQNAYDVASILNDMINVKVSYKTINNKQYCFTLKNTGKKSNKDIVIMSDLNGSVLKDESFLATMITERNIEQMIRDYESYL